MSSPTLGFSNPFNTHFRLVLISISSQVWWHMSVFPNTHELEARGSLELRSSEISLVNATRSPGAGSRLKS
jgi:hypothetical protein